MRAIFLGGVLGKVPRPSPAMVVALLALLIAASGAAIADIPSRWDGVITACRDNRSAVLRVIDAENGQTCGSKETEIAWKDGFTGKVADSELLDGYDSDHFYAAGSKVADSEKLDGQDSTAFLGANQKAADSDKLDGVDSTQFMGTFSGRMDAFTSESNSAQFKTISVQCPGTGRVVDGYAEISPNTASEPIPVALQTVGSLGNNIWKATASEMVPYDGNWGISVNVLCVKSPPGP